MTDLKLNWILQPTVAGRLDLLPATATAFDLERGDISDLAAWSLVEMAGALDRVLKAPERCHCVACGRTFRRGEKPGAFLVGAIDEVKAWPVCDGCGARPDAETIRRADASLSQSRAA